MSTSAAPPRMCCASHFFVFCGIGEMGGRRPCPGRRVSLNERRHPPNRRCSQACAACVDLAACAQDARTGRFMARQFIYHMQGLSKTYPGNRKVLENINLSFYPDSKVDQAMDALRCPADDADVPKLSGGERRRVALCKLLLEQPDLLLLDEPTNHLDAESVHWLEGHLRNYPGAILIVTHDRYFLDNVTGWILELDRGRGIPYEG